jgi:hypothetical protein
MEFSVEGLGSFLVSMFKYTRYLRYYEVAQKWFGFICIIYGLNISLSNYAYIASVVTACQGSSNRNGYHALNGNL